MKRISLLPKVMRFFCFLGLFLAFAGYDLKGEAMKSEYVNKIEVLFNGLNKDTMNILGDFYAENIRFIDPIGEHTSLDSVRRYYENLYQNVQSIRFEFQSHVVQENKVTSEWIMFLKASALNSGNEMSLDGVSVFEFDPQTKKAIYHRDYFDMGEFIYEQIPVVRSIIRFIKGRLKS